MDLFTLETGYRTTTGGPVAAAADGRVLWLTGGPEFPGKGAFHIGRMEARESFDSGRTWGPPRVLLQGDKEATPGSMALVNLRSGRLLHLFSRYGGYSHDHDPAKSLNEGYAHWSEDNGATWSDPIKLPTGERYLSSVLSACQLTTGRVVFPFGYLMSDGTGNFVVSAVYSDDEGETWRRSPDVLRAGGSGFESGACEPSVVELPDGRVWMLIRAQTGFQWESFSSDGGETWTPARPSRLPSSNAPAVFLRLASGRVIVAWNNCVTTAYARHSLLVAATDDGRSFSGFRELAHTDYPMTSTDTYWCVTYPYLCEAPDGTVLVSFNQGDWGYNQARLARFRPGWLEERALVEDFRDGRGAWCALGSSHRGEIVAPEDDDPGASLLVKFAPPGPSGMTRNFPLLTRGEVRLTLSVHSPEAYVILHDSFPLPGRVGEACVRARVGPDGQVFLGTGAPATRSPGQAAWMPQYSYLAYPVERETPYPARMAYSARFTLTLHCDIVAREAGLRINDGPRIRAPLADVLGLCYLGIAATEGGAVRVRRVEWGA